MDHRLLQVNVGHSARAQDILLQHMAEWSIDIALVAEPYCVPSRHNWFGDLGGSAAIVSSGPSLLVMTDRGEGYICVDWEGTVLIGVYFSPNRRLAEFEQFLGAVGAVINRYPSRQVLVAGDFNAKSTAWGSPVTDARGDALEEWAIATGLVVLNRGSVATCVRWQGESIVDISFASPAVARRVRDWQVLVEAESLSDHRYVRFDISASPAIPDDRPRRMHTPSSPRWALKRLDADVLVEASIVQAWTPMGEGPVEVEQESEWFRGAMTLICDASMPRASAQPPRRQVYWWSEDISQKRAACIAARRQYTRYRRRRRYRDLTVEARLRGAYKQRKYALQSAISEAKAQRWEEFLGTLEADPWGRPYKAVRGKLRPWAPPVTESLQPRQLEEVVSALFPSRAEHTPPEMAPPDIEEGGADAGAPEVTMAELGAAMVRLRGKTTAPGPDGIPGRAWVLAFDALGDRLLRLFNACLESGRFPSMWKTGKLVLLRKEGRPADSPSAYRPIVLLDEAGKLFERVVVARLSKHLVRVGPDLSEAQFGFREGRSTIDAISRVKALSEEAVASRGVLLAVSLDIANAFNTLPWATIREALRFHGVPPYLRRIVGDYLHQRSVFCVGRNGETFRREMSCGVPQGSVLGPILWNIGYDWVLRGALPPGVGVTCYADDTLVTARGVDYGAAARLATAGVALVVGRIRMLGLEVALEKSEALLFHGPRRAPPPDAHIIVGGVRIGVEPSMKYLGLHLDGRWNFRVHFSRLAPRLMSAAGALSSLLPNIGGPSVVCRRLYMGVVRSMALYGAPIWANALDRRNIALLRRPQRAMAIRVSRAYRTVSFEAACVLAASPPWDLEAEVQASVYHWRADLRLHGEEPSHRAVETRRSQARLVLEAKWAERLAQPRYGVRTVEAVRPVLRQWMDRRRGPLTYRLTQVLSGHGCFGEYLCKIAGREPTTRCHHCEECDQDTAQHTLQECPAWAAERCALVAVIGPDLSLPTVVSKMVGDDRCWGAMRSFCEAVISQKEAAERGREEDPYAPEVRRRRGGRRRRAYVALLPPT